jgi:hypothetical protein
MQVLKAFGETAQEEVDLQELSDSLLRVVEHHVKPAHVSLFLVDPKSQREQ